MNSVTFHAKTFKEDYDQFRTVFHEAVMHGLRTNLVTALNYRLHKLQEDSRNVAAIEWDF